MIVVGPLLPSLELEYCRQQHASIITQPRTRNSGRNQLDVVGSETYHCAWRHHRGLLSLGMVVGKLWQKQHREQGLFRLEPDSS